MRAEHSGSAVGIGLRAGTAAWAACRPQGRAWCVRGACVVRAWCVRGACVVRACVVRAWCVRGACVVRAWCVRGACVVHAWCVRGVCVARAWSVCGACVAHAWCVHGACVVRVGAHGRAANTTRGAGCGYPPRQPSGAAVPSSVSKQKSASLGHLPSAASTPPTVRTGSRAPA
jgi:hypothetical protein